VNDPTSIPRPDLSVAVCTRNREQDIAPCLASILANTDADFEVVVVDQSDAPRSRAWLKSAMDDTRVRHRRSPSRGLSRARNEAVEASRGHLIAFTDDDCRVPSDWVARIRAFFSAHADVSLAFGRVIAPPELRARGYLAGFEPDDICYRGRFPSPMIQWGMGANMAFRRTAIDRAGGFDPCLGAGARLSAGEELDFEMRVIGAGLAVAHTNEFELTHLGVREHAAARALFRSYAIGTGAAYGKNLRLRTPRVVPLFASWLVQQGTAVARASAAGRRPSGAGVLLTTLEGCVRAMRLPLDQDRKSFKSDVGSLSKTVHCVQ
jgi:hypothetical protein